MKYPIGTTLRLINTSVMAAPQGAIAVVTGAGRNADAISVKWQDNSHGQSDGNYRVNRFEAIDPRVVLDLKIAALQAQRAALDEIHVGDKVITPRNNHGTVKAIDDEEAWVKTKRGQNVVHKIANLKKEF